MKTKYLPLLSFLVALVFLGCNSTNSSQDDSAANDDAADSTATEQESADAVTSPNVALLIRHDVKDFDTWKKAYDDHAEARAEAKMSDWALLTGKDNPNAVTAIQKVGDVEAARAFIESEDLKSKMSDAGVTGEPAMQFANVEMIDQEAAKSSKVRLYAMHKVKDYDQWKSVFDAKADMHAEAGVRPIAIARNVDDPNDLTVVLTADDFETLEKFINNDDLKSAMEEAGVEGKPEFNFMNLHSINF